MNFVAITHSIILLGHNTERKWYRNNFDIKIIVLRNACELEVVLLYVLDCA